MTFPKTIELISSGEIFADSSAPLEAARPRAVASIFLSFPPYVPNAVRLAATINTPEQAKKKKNKNKLKSFMQVKVFEINDGDRIPYFQFMSKLK